MAAEFLKPFPMLEDVLIEFWQEGVGMGNPYTSTPATSAYGRQHSVANQVIQCSNPNCKGGGFDILRDVSGMVHERLTAKEFVQVCRNSQGSMEGRGRSCANLLYYRLVLEYTPGQSPN